MTTTSELPCYTLIHVPTEVELPSEQQLKEKFEKGDDKARIDALKKLIFMVCNGEKVSQMLIMFVIRFLLPSSNHTIKKLLLLFWENVPKYGSDGKLLREMILVCDAYRKDLQHPNEFVRGSTLRFLCKLKEPELLEPLMPSIRKCLEHKHSYVRRNAVMAIFTIYRNFEHLIPDAPELVSGFLEAEQDASCRRNAFMMLLHVDQQRALDFLASCMEQINSFGDILQLIIVELVYKVCHANPVERGKYIRCIYNLLQSQSAAVRYEAAGTLVTLSTAPAAVKEAAKVYIDLIVKQPDNNVKLIVLDRLITLRGAAPSCERVLQELVIEILRVLSAPDLEVRQKTLTLCLDLVTSRNVEQMVMVLKKEMTATAEGAAAADSSGKYRQALVRTLHAATIKFPDVAPTCVPVLLELLGEDDEAVAGAVLEFVREALHAMPALAPAIIASLQDALPSIRRPRICIGALWILATFAGSSESVHNTLRIIKESLGELPIVDSELKAAEALNDGAADKPKTDGTPAATDATKKAAAAPRVTADGTYATQSALSAAVKADAAKRAERHPLRKFLLEGDFFVGASLATVVHKLSERFARLHANRPDLVHGQRAEAMFQLASIVHLGRSGLSKTPATEDDLDRLGLTIKLLAGTDPKAAEVLLKECEQSLAKMLASSAHTSGVSALNGTSKPSESANRVDVDKTIAFTQLIAPSGANAGDASQNLFDLSLSQAMGTAPKAVKFDFSSSRLGKIVQLSGFSDPVYAETFVNVNQYDIVLDVLIVNQTADTMQNVSLELSTVGDLKLVDKPQPLTLGPHAFANIKAVVKVAAAENGVIFSTISYDVRGSTSDRCCVYLHDIKIDIMDYITPGSCTDAEFRQMWLDFEWENKVNVNTTITDLREFLSHLAGVTNMKLLTSEQALAGECGFLAANLCAHSIFGEDALANVSVEKTDPADPDSALAGHIRIRAKSQGMALTLGDKINVSQRERK